MILPLEKNCDARCGCIYYRRLAACPRCHEPNKEKR